MHYATRVTSRRLRRLTVLAGAAALAAGSLLTLAGPARAATVYTITSISPSSGPASGGNSITITGSGFDGVNCGFDNPVPADDVIFGLGPGTGTFATNVHLVSDSEMTATVPAGTPGTIQVVVSDSADSCSNNFSNSVPYTYTGAGPVVTGVSPASGPEAGGTTVTITGTGLTGATAVDFGSAAASSFTVTSDTQITATAPASASLGTVDVTVTTAAGTSATSAADHYAYVNPVAEMSAAGRFAVTGNQAEFGMAADRMQPGTAPKGHLEYDDQADGVHINQASFTDLYLTSPATAHATGTASCTIGGTTSSCPITVTATDSGNQAGSFTLTYGTTTVGGTLLDGHVEVGPETHGGGTSASPATAAARPRLLGSLAGGAVTATPAAAAMTGSFTASLLGISLTGARCGSGTLVYSDGTATGTVSCLLLGAAGITIDVDVPVTAGNAGTGTATVSGTATVTVAGLLPVSLPTSVTLTATGPGAGLRITIGGTTLPLLPVSTGSLEIG